MWPVSKRLIALFLVGLAGVASYRRLRRRPRQGSPSPVSTGNQRARTLELARVGSRAGANYVSMTARATFASEERRSELRSEFELRTAEQVAETLGNMKGAAMKLGQMASYLDQGLPEPVREVLATLQTDAPPMSAELAAAMIRDELGADPEVVFAQWSPMPLASASIGQVHRAVTHDGQVVAVKVQYPGVDEAIRADLANSDLLFWAMGFMFPGMDPKPIVAELRDRITEELDYRTEAAHQTRFAEQYLGHPTIHVPAVLPEYSTGRVLCTDFAVGAGFAEVVSWSQAERDLAAETLFRFAFGGIYRLGAFNGDPHPGNYLFRPGGEVTFLDYGLCKIFTPDEVSIFERLIRAMVFERDMVAFASFSEEIGVLRDAAQFSEQQIFDYFSHFYEFVLTDETTTMTHEYASRSVRQFFDLSGPSADIMKNANLPPSLVIIQRINLGLFALFAELGATGNWRRLGEEIWPFVDGPPSTPMGEAIADWEGRRAKPTA